MRKPSPEDEASRQRTRETLVERLRNWDDSGAWKEFFDTYWMLFYSRARAAGLGVQEAEDVVQGVMRDVARQIPKFAYDPTGPKFRGWLKRIVWGKIVDQFKKRPKESPLTDAIRKPTDQTSATSTEGRVGDPISNVERDWDVEYANYLLTVAADRVKPKVTPESFAIYAFHVLEWHTVEETRIQFGISAAKVFLVKFRVGRRMQRELRRLGYVPATLREPGSDEPATGVSVPVVA